MEKKSILTIILIVIIILIVGFLASEFLYQSQVSVGDIKFSIPEGYHKGANNNANDINLTNGYNSIFITKYNDSDVNKHVLEMREFVKTQNHTPIITNFTVDNITVYKLTIVNNTQYYRYWFVDKDITYGIYTWDGNTNTDNLVSKLIKSTQNS